MSKNFDFLRDEMKLLAENQKIILKNMGIKAADYVFSSASAKKKINRQKRNTISSSLPSHHIRNFSSAYQDEIKISDTGI